MPSAICPPSAPPSLEVVNMTISVNPIDEIPGIDKELVEGFRTWHSAPPCGVRPPRF